MVPNCVNAYKKISKIMCNQIVSFLSKKLWKDLKQNHQHNMSMYFRDFFLLNCIEILRIYFWKCFNTWIFDHCKFTSQKSRIKWKHYKSHVSDSSSMKFQFFYKQNWIEGVNLIQIFFSIELLKFGNFQITQIKQNCLKWCFSCLLLSPEYEREEKKNNQERSRWKKVKSNKRYLHTHILSHTHLNENDKKAESSMTRLKSVARTYEGRSS